MAVRRPTLLRVRSAKMLVPALLIFYGSLSAYVAQTHLIFGKYLDKFDVTEKTFKSV